jgi:hypothetical protein
MIWLNVWGLRGLSALRYWMLDFESCSWHLGEFAVRDQKSRRLIRLPGLQERPVHTLRKVPRFTGQGRARVPLDEWPVEVRCE